MNLSQTTAGPVRVALFGATAGQGVVWYTGQFYALYFIQTILNIQGSAANKIIAIALIFGTPLFVFFGWLSDRVGRKRIMMAGCVIAALAYMPIYAAMQRAVPPTKDFALGQPTIERAIDPVTKKETVTAVSKGERDGFTIVKKEIQPPKKGVNPNYQIVPTTAAFWTLAALVWLQVVFVTMVYGPIAAFLVELFPTRIRYTSMSLPYHIGNGVFGGLVPLIGTAVVAATDNKLSGLWYPISIAAITAILGSALIHEKRTADGFSETS